MLRFYLSLVIQQSAGAARALQHLLQNLLHPLATKNNNSNTLLCQEMKHKVKTTYKWFSSRCWHDGQPSSSSSSESLVVKSWLVSSHPGNRNKTVSGLQFQIKGINWQYCKKKMNELKMKKNPIYLWENVIYRFYYYHYYYFSWNSYAPLCAL